jgi:hypothetical protein
MVVVDVVGTVVDVVVVEVGVVVAVLSEATQAPNAMSTTRAVVRDTNKEATAVWPVNCG